MKKFYFLLAFSWIFQSLQAQYSHQDILLGQTGSTLLNNLVLNYKPSSLPTYAVARDNMFGQVYEEDDTVTCVYTGLKRYLPPLADPTTAMFDSGSNISVDAEHTYPQSKTINEAGKSDLHHMYPTRAMANNGRGSLPFSVIPVNNIDKWYHLDQILTNAPAANVLHLYSKQENGVTFEPREDHKGNAARAVFYYYTMYKTEADAADPNFFNIQKTTLCQWHLDDPVDSMEWIRTSRIALYQNNRVNPFVMDCTLPQRCGYCTSICSPPNAITRQEEMGLELMDNFPNPFEQSTTIQYELSRSQHVILEVYNTVGQKIATLANEMQDSGLQQFTFEANDLPNGIYFYTLTLEYKGQTAIFHKSMVIN